MLNQKITAKKLIKSKTININALVLAAIGIANALNVEIPQEAATGIVAIVNIILRFFTDSHLSEK